MVQQAQSSLHRVHYATWLNKSRVHCHYFDRTKSLYLAGTLVVWLERLGLLGGEFLATFCSGGLPDVGDVLSTDGSASGIPGEGGVSCVFFRCTLLRLYTVPSVSSTSYDLSSSLSTTFAFFHDLSPSLNRFHPHCISLVQCREITGRPVVVPCLSSLDHLQLIRFLFRYGRS